MTVTITKPSFNLRDALVSLKRKIGIKGAELMAAETVSDVYTSLNPVMFRNRVHNGDMRIDQRNSGALVTGGSYAVDRFLTVTTGITSLSVSSQQVVDAPTVAGFKYSYKITTTAAATAYGTGGRYGILHRIEGLNVIDFGFGTSSASPVTISFWVKTSLPGLYSVCIYNSNSDRGYPATYTITSAGTWEYKTVIIPGDITGTWTADNTRCFQVEWCLGADSSRLGTANTWNSSFVTGATGNTRLSDTLNATFQLTGVQLEKGTVATPFEHRLYGTELALCQRYYQQHGFYGVVGQGQNTDRNSGSYVPFFVPMRTTPTTASKIYDVDIGDLNIAFTPIIYTDAIGQGIGWRPYRNVATTITRGDTMEILANAGTEGGPRHPFSAEF
jgi:hypothetical protein